MFSGKLKGMALFPSLIDWTKVDSAMASACVPVGQSHISDSLFAKNKPAFPGAVLLVGIGGEVVYKKAFGSRSLLPQVTALHEDMVFDVASLTKVIVTTTLAMMMVEEDQLDLDWRISRIFQTFATHGKEQMTVRHLLCHMSGYPATAPFYKVIAKADSNARTGVMTSRGAVEIIHNEIFRAKLDNLPGRVTKYSDIGFILLGHAIEHLSGSTLERLANRVVFGPLDMKSSGFIDLPLLKRKGIEPDLDKIVPTARCPWRGRILLGEVHDDNAWAMGGIAPHAGVFSTADDVHKFANEMIRCWKGEDGLIKQSTIRKFWTKAGLEPSSSWALGWDTPSDSGSSAGKFFSKSSVGHLAFSGCSLWIDPERELDVVLLSNRIHPTPENVSIRDFRPLIHDLVMEALGFSDSGGPP